MTKTHIIETIEEYDANGKITRKTVTETTEENNDPTPSYWPQWYGTGSPTWADKTITYCNSEGSRTTTTSDGSNCSGDTVCDCSCDKC